MQHNYSFHSTLLLSKSPLISSSNLIYIFFYSTCKIWLILGCSVKGNTILKLQTSFRLVVIHQQNCAARMFESRQNESIFGDRSSPKKKKKRSK